MWGLKCSAIESEMNALDWSVWWGVERVDMEKEREYAEGGVSRGRGSLHGNCC